MSQNPLTKVIVTFTTKSERILERIGRDEALRGLELVICDDIQGNCQYGYTFLFANQRTVQESFSIMTV